MNINRLAHDYIHTLPRGQEEIINDMLRKYKKEIELGIVEITPEKVKQVKKVEIPEKIEEEYISIPIYENIKEEDKEAYKKLKEDRNKRVYAKFGMEYKGSER